jgi:hypothetical protein
MAYRWTMEDIDKGTARPHATGPRVTTLTPSTPKPSKPSKYRNVKVTDAAGAVHDSTKEFKHWQELQLRERAGEIRSLRRQVPFALVVGGVLVCTYVADFVYEIDAATIVEDCKSPPTRKLAAYSIKRKLMQAIHGIQIREV